MAVGTERLELGEINGPNDGGTKVQKASYNTSRKYLHICCGTYWQGGVQTDTLHSRACAAAREWPAWRVREEASGVT